MKFKIGMVVLCLSVLSACDSGSNDPVAQNDPSKIDPPKIVAEDTGVDSTTTSVQSVQTTQTTQTTTTAASAGTEVVLATGLAESNVEAHLVKATRDGDKLTVIVRFKKEPNKGFAGSLYRESNNSFLENCYLVSGNKKYFILKDSEGNWLAPRELTLPGNSGGITSWSTTFPAPPAGQQATLHIGSVEPLGPFTVP